MGTGKAIDFSDPRQLGWFASKQFIPLPVQSFVRGLEEEGVGSNTAIATGAAFLGVPEWTQKTKPYGK